MNCFVSHLVGGEISQIILYVFFDIHLYQRVLGDAVVCAFEVAVQLRDR